MPQLGGCRGLTDGSARLKAAGKDEGEKSHFPSFSRLYDSQICHRTSCALTHAYIHVYTVYVYMHVNFIYIAAFIQKCSSKCFPTLEVTKRKMLHINGHKSKNIKNNHSDSKSKSLKNKQIQKNEPILNHCSNNSTSRSCRGLVCFPLISDNLIKARDSSESSCGINLEPLPQKSS